MEESGGHQEPQGSAAMAGRRRRSLIGFDVYCEFAFAALIVFATYKVAAFYFSAGFLPQPFFDDVSDTFMDWYNTVYWGYRHGTYDEWFSIYPPFAFLLMKFFSISSCYDESSAIGRLCDPVGVWVVFLFTIINLVLVFTEYRAADKRFVFPRTLALGLGLPALFALERGNVIVLCFTAFILAHGRLLRSTWLRCVAFAITVNLKPYLIIVVVARLLRRRWRWVEGCAIATVLLYVASLMLFGRGAPAELIANWLTFAGPSERVALDIVEYTTTYNSMLEMARAPIPLMHYIGSSPIEFVEAVVPWAIRLGAIGVVVCLAGASFRPWRVSSQRLAALAVALFLSTSQGGGAYAELFLIFLVFFERWSGVGASLAIIAAYMLCVPWDYTVVNIISEIWDSYLSGRAVEFQFGLTLGALIRPGLILLIEYGLIVATLGDLLPRPSTRRGVAKAMNDAWVDGAAARPA